MFVAAPVLPRVPDKVSDAAVSLPPSSSVAPLLMVSAGVAVKSPARPNCNVPLCTMSEVTPMGAFSLLSLVVMKVPPPRPMFEVPPASW